MTRLRYTAYVLGRAVQSLAIAAAAAAGIFMAERAGLLSAAWTAPAPLLGAWVWPALAAAAAHLALGPKQNRPVYRKVQGAMYVYAGVPVDRNAGSRGGCITGSTGSGKTLCCILPRLHSLCLNEAGIERPGWRTSRAGRSLERLRERQGSERNQLRLRQAADRNRRSRFLVPPWGGLVCGEKGNEWRMMAALLARHGRSEDLCVLATRPDGAPEHWLPPVRYNLLSLHSVPADTYAKALVDSALAVEESGTRDEFFVPQARDKIAWAIRLARSGRRVAEGARSAADPSLLTVLEILMSEDGYRRFVGASICAEPALEDSAAFAEARRQLETTYWNQPAEQLGGVRSTIQNFLAAYAEPQVAAVFCTDSTFDLADIEEGKVVCLALPQKLAVQRRYVTALLKALVYQIILRRFDRHGPSAGQNVVLVEQDEWQRHAVAADCEVDVIREAGGAVYAATQSQNAVWAKLGGRERASPVIANLRNRWICQAATEECASESSGVIGGRLAREISHATGSSGRTTSVSYAQRPRVPPHLLRSLPPFHVVFVPAEGPWLYRVVIAMPATPEGAIPPWWFGDWNPLHWAAAGIGLRGRVAGIALAPERPLIAPWRAAAPLRAQLRWLLGLDGTFIVLGGLRASAALDKEYGNSFC